MTVFTCENDFEAMLSAIYDAFMSRLGYGNVRLQLEPVEQYSLFDEYRHVEADRAKAEEVARSISGKISGYFYAELAYCMGAYEPDMLNTVYRVLVLGFKYGPSVLNMYQFKDVARINEIRTRYGREACSFLEFVRFHQVGNVYVAHIEPKSNVLLPVSEHFSDRMPSEHWMIVDDVHMQAAVHPKDSFYYIRRLTQSELGRLLLTEQENDIYTDLWQGYFDHIAIKERENYICQLNHISKWKRKHVTEFCDR